MLDPDAAEKAKIYMAKIRNDVMLMLSAKKASELTSREGKQTLALELRNQVNGILDPDGKAKKQHQPAGQGNPLHVVHHSVETPLDVTGFPLPGRSRRPAQGRLRDSDEPEQVESNESGVRAYNLGTQERIVRGRMPTLELINERFARYLRIGLFNYMHRNAEISVARSVSRNTASSSAIWSSRPTST